MLGKGAPVRTVDTMDPLRHVTTAQKVIIARKLRRMATPAERHAWTLLRNRGVLGLKFRRQRIVRGFIVDFVCATEQLILELEGDVHDDPDRRVYDAARADVLQGAGYRVVRIRNRDVTREYLHDLLRDLTRRPGGPHPLSPSPQCGEGERYRDSDDG
jgi:very-short-patch-repair endonuclease